MAMKKVRLKEGLRCILEKRKDVGVVAVQVWVKVGSRYEDDRIAGITHFIEHLIFKGTEKGEGFEIAPRIEALGGSINAFTSYDNTVYHIVIPTKAFDQGFGLLTESVKSPAFPQGEIEKEKKVVIEEIKMGEDDPQRKLFKELFSASYSRPPLRQAHHRHRGVRFRYDQRADILSYFKTHYSPRPCRSSWWVILTKSRCWDCSRSAFQAWPLRASGAADRGHRGGPRPRAGEDRGEGCGRELSRPLLSRRVVHAPRYSGPRCAFQDPHGRRQLAPAVDSEAQGRDSHRHGHLPLRAPGRRSLRNRSHLQGTGLRAAFTCLERELERLSKGGVEQWEIEKAKNLVRASYVYGEETVQGKARLVGNFDTLADDPDYAEKYLEAIGRVDTNDVTRVLDTYILGRPKAVAALLPKKAPNPCTFHLENGFRCIYNRNTASPSFSFMIGFMGVSRRSAPGRTAASTSWLACSCGGQKIWTPRPLRAGSIPLRGT